MRNTIAKMVEEVKAIEIQLAALENRLEEIESNAVNLDIYNDFWEELHKDGEKHWI